MQVRSAIASILLTFSVLSAQDLGKTPRPLPDVQLPAPGNKTINLRQYRGKVLTVVMISTKCPECIETVGMLNRLQSELGPKGLQVIGLAANTNKPEDVTAFIARYRPAYPFGWIDPPTFMKIAGLTPDIRPTVPTFVFVDRKGTVQAQFFGNITNAKNDEQGVREWFADLSKPGGGTKTHPTTAAPTSTTNKK
jgi:peroxiredoxin